MASRQSAFARAGAIWLLVVTAARVVMSNVRLAGRIWNPRRPLQYHAVAVPDGGPDEVALGINIPAERLLRLLRPGRKGRR